ncbi:MAG: RnfABCDGE type electron transport complex subunit D [Clostridia bacterium]|nr:RnfABCDGE type electron transport complex subunit D [Clostridia bacterium]
MTDTNIPQNSIDEAKRSVTLDYILMLCVPLAVAVFNHGLTAMFNCTFSFLTCYLLVKLSKNFLKTEFPPKAPQIFIIAVSVSLLLPAASPWWMTILTSAFAIGVCVLPFGNLENAPFVPSAAAICFASLCWNDVVYNYSDVGDSLGKMLLFGNSIGKNLVAVTEALVGSVPSAMGTGCILALIGVLIFVIIRRPKDSIAPICFILSAGIISALFPRVSTGIAISVVMELSSGMLLFGAVFFLSAPTIAPKRPLSKAVWGFVGGIICMLVKYVSPLEDSTCFSFLIICAISDYFDNLPLTLNEKRRIKAQEPYIEIEPVASVVPEKILEEIPDMTIREIIEQTDEPEETEEQSSYESESLEAVVSEENTLTDSKAPFVMGGGDDE